MDNKKYIYMSVLIVIAIIMCILVFTFLPFKELPFIYNEF
ncbi:MAG: hypothetical protein PEPC_00750 [Peptostreptococcus russellii]